jgi:hypothetical protein
MMHHSRKPGLRYPRRPALPALSYLRRRRKKRKHAAAGGEGAMMAIFRAAARLLVYNSIMTEGGVLVFNVCRKHAYGACTIDYAITDGTAVAGIDYNASADALTGTLTFADRELYKTISIQTLTRGGAQGNRTLTCTLSNPSGVSIEDATATGTIQDGTITTFTSADSIATIQAAIAGASAGDAILLTRGHTWEMTAAMVFDAAGGTAANPVIVGATGSGADPELNPAASMSQAIWFRGNNSDAAPKYISIQDLVIRSTGAPGSRAGSGILISEGTRTFKPGHISLLRTSILSNAQGIIAQVAGGFHLFECCTIQDNFGIDPPEGGGHTQGIFFDDTDSDIRFCHFKNNGKATVIFDWNIYLSTAERTTVEYCRFEGGAGGIKVRTGDNITVRGNEVYTPDHLELTFGTDADGPSLTNFLAEENYIHGGTGGMYISNQSGSDPAYSATGIVRNNIVSLLDASFSGAAVLFAGDAFNENWKFFNNTIIAGGGAKALYINEAITGTEIRNNIFYRLDTDGTTALIDCSTVAAQASFTATNNLFYRNGDPTYRVNGTDYTDLAAYTAAYPGEEADSVEADPLFNDVASQDYSLGGGSPAIYAGFDVIADVAADFIGFARALPLDIGAFETEPTFGSVTFAGGQYISGISGVSPNGQRMTIAVRVKLSALGRRYFHGPNSPFRWRYEGNGSGSASIHDDNGANQILAQFLGAGFWATDTWYNIVAHYDFASGDSYWNVNGSDAATSGATDADNIDHSGLTMFSNGGIENFEGDVDFLWISFGGDPVKATLLADLFESTAGAHTYLGSSGVAAGVTPDLYVAGNAALWNSGTGIVGTFTMNGTVTDA